MLGTDGQVLSLGEAKWKQTMGLPHLDRLRQARDLLAAKGHRITGTRLACYSGAGFTPDLLRTAETENVLLVDLPALYAQP